jgi:hypothetical protein
MRVCYSYLRYYKVGKSVEYVADELLVHYVLDGFLVTTLEKFSLCIRLFFLRSLLTLLLLSVLFSELFKTVDQFGR